MLLNEINFKMPIYKDCTFGELIFVGSLVFLVEIFILSLITRLLIGYASIGIAITFVTFWLITKFAIGKLQRIKYGKPYGYYKQYLLLKIQPIGFARHLYITRLGKWSTRRNK